MSFSLFSTPFFICLGICLIVIGVLGFFISKEFISQNHKIGTMCDLVTTLAQDLQMVKMQQTVDKLQSSIPQSSVVGGGSEVTNSNLHLVLTPQLPSGNGTSGDNTSDGKNSSTQVTPVIVNRIVVSDVDTDEDEDEEDEDESTDNDEDESDNNESDDEEDDRDIQDVDAINKYKNENECVSLDGSLGGLDFDIHAENNKICTMDFESLELFNDVEINPVIIVNKLPDVSDKEIETEPSIGHFEPFDLEEPFLPENNNTDIKIINDIMFSSHLSGGTEGETKQQNGYDDSANTEDNLICGVEVDSETNYSKMNLPQLRKLVADKKLATNPTKLKKTELIQLLTENNL